MPSSDPPVPESTPPASSLGQTLQNARLAQDLTIEQVAAELRIEVKQLKALEDNRFTDIGPTVFVKGYLKQYGQRVGLDVRDLLALYYRQTDLSDVQIQPNRTIKLRDERQITSWLLAAIVLLAVVVGLAVWWWGGGNLELLSRGSTANAPATSQPLAVDAAPPPAAPIDQVPVEAASTAAPAVLSEPAAGDAAESPVETEAPPAEGTVSLEFTFDAESWAEVTDARGERLLFGLNEPGRQVTVRGAPPIDVLLGNANAVRLTVDGRDYSIPTRGREGDLARFSVDAAQE